MQPVKITRNLYRHGSYDEQKDSVLFVHGLAQNHNYLYHGPRKPIGRYENYNCFSFNYRDFGRPTGARYSLADARDTDLRQTLERLLAIEEKQLRIVTFSFGGALLLELLGDDAFRAAIQDRIHRIVCVAPLNYSPRANRESGFKYSSAFHFIGLYTCLPLRYIMLLMKLPALDFSYWKTVNCIPAGLMNEIKQRCANSQKTVMPEDMVSRTLIMTSAGDLFCPGEMAMDFFPNSKKGEANLAVENDPAIGHKNIFFQDATHERILGWIK